MSNITTMIHVNPEADEVALEMWLGDRKMTMYTDQESTYALLSDDNDAMFEERDLHKALKWFMNGREHA